MRFASFAILFLSAGCSSSGAAIDADEAVVRIVDAGLHNPVVRDAQIVELPEPTTPRATAYPAIVRLRVPVSPEVEAPIDAGVSE